MKLFLKVKSRAILYLLILALAVAWNYIPLSVASTPPLHVEGKYVKDSFGNKIFLNGVWKGGYADSCVGWWIPVGGFGSDGVAVWDETAVRAHLQAMKDWGFNVIAVFLNIDWWVNDKATTLYREQNNIDIPTSHSYRYSIKETLRLASEYGIYVQLRPLTTSVAEGRTYQPIYPSTSYFGGDLETSKQGFINFWVNLATELQSYSNVIFHLYDEPTTERGNTQADWFDVATRTINAIRAAGITQIIMVHWGYAGSVSWIEQWFNEGRPTTNVVFTAHIYRFHGTFEGNPNSPTDINYIRDQLGNARGYLNIIDTLKLPLWVTLGAYNGATDNSEYEYFQNTLTVLNEWETGYVVFVYRQDMPWTIQESGPTVAPLNRVGEALVTAISPPTNGSNGTEPPPNNDTNTNLTLPPPPTNMPPQKLVNNLTYATVVIIAMEVYFLWQRKKRSSS